MKTPAQQQILFFVDGPVPTAEDHAAAKALGTMTFRNSRKSGAPPKGGCKVASLGTIPENYAKAKGVTVVKAPKAGPTAEEIAAKAQAEAQAQAEAEAEAARNKNKR